MSLIEELATALQAVGTLKAVGEQWISFDGSIPNGGVPFCGQIVTREMYPDLWNLMNKNGRVISEANWQAHAKANGGTCPYYSTGDGSTTFRMPNVCHYFRAGNVGEAGKYTPEGLPNIEGYSATWGYVGEAWTHPDVIKGAFTLDEGAASNLRNYGQANPSTNRKYAIKFDASASNAIYGNSDHVTPETYNVLVGVYAVGIVTNVGATELETIRSALAKLEASAVKTVNNVAPTAGNVTVLNWGKPNKTYTTLDKSKLFYTTSTEGFLVARQNTTTTEMVFNVNNGWEIPLKYASTITIPLKKGDSVFWDSGAYLTNLFFVSNEV